MIAKKLYYTLFVLYFGVVATSSLFKELSFPTILLLIFSTIGSWMTIYQFVFSKVMRFPSFDLAQDRIILRLFFLVFALIFSMLFIPSIIITAPYR